jgi:hypothetical protein
MSFIYFVSKCSDAECTDVMDRFNLDDDLDSATETFKDLGADLVFEDGYESHKFVGGVYEVTYVNGTKHYFVLCSLEIDFTAAEVMR